MSMSEQHAAWFGVDSSADTRLSTDSTSPTDVDITDPASHGSEGEHRHGKARSVAFVALTLALVAGLAFGIGKASGAYERQASTVPADDSVQVSSTWVSRAPWASAPSPTIAPLAPWVGVPAPQEDEPGWDCTTMGNRDCGPSTSTTVAEPVVASTVAEQVVSAPSNGLCSTDCGIEDSPADVPAKRAAGIDYTAALSACVPALADQLAGYTLTAEQAGDIAYLASLSLVRELRMGTLDGYLDGSIPRDMLIDPSDHPALGDHCK